MRGLWRLAKGERAGILDFGAGPENFSASIAPLIAFPLVGALVVAMQGAWQLGVISFLSRLTAVLVLPVLTYEFAKLFGREHLWLRTATVLNWSFWVIPPILMLAAIAAAGLEVVGLSTMGAARVALAIMGLYLLWFRWFALRAGLGLGAWQALLVVTVSTAAIIGLMVLPFMFGVGGPLPGLPSS
ncbi:hypothetical protein [Acidocella sp.]|uniref:hypothetical protein n=1 Tax=Acidocella sp. TaxID=50710 RepID=UPI00262AEB45|nr:hypothetical protein [Acidocella sp.]